MSGLYDDLPLPNKGNQGLNESVKNDQEDVHNSLKPRSIHVSSNVTFDGTSLDSNIPGQVSETANTPASLGISDGLDLIVPRSVITKQTSSVTEKPTKPNPSSLDKQSRQSLTKSGLDEDSLKNVALNTNSTSTSSFMPSHVNIEDPYDPLKPNMYEDYVREKEEAERQERKKAEKEMISTIPLSARSQTRS